MVHSQVHQRVCIFACCGSARTFVAARSKERRGTPGPGPGGPGTRSREPLFPTGKPKEETLPRLIQTGANSSLGL